jgi:hypothetical protein
MDNSGLDIHASQDLERNKSPLSMKKGSKARLSKASLAKVEFADYKKEAKSKEVDSRRMRTPMDPQ